MTEKELLYMEDAVSHETIIISICEDITEKLEDEELKNFFKREIEKHQSIEEGLKNLLEAKINE